MILAGAFGAHGSAVQLDQLAYQREAQAEAGLDASARPLRLAKTFEDVRQKFSRDTAAGVLNTQMDLVDDSAQ